MISGLIEIHSFLLVVFNEGSVGIPLGVVSLHLPSLRDVLELILKDLVESLHKLFGNVY